MSSIKKSYKPSRIGRNPQEDFNLKGSIWVEKWRAVHCGGRIILLENIEQAGQSERIMAVAADVYHMPFADNSIDLVISRSSIFFWEDRFTDCLEIYHTLKPGGAAATEKGDDGIWIQMVK